MLETAVGATVVGVCAGCWERVAGAAGLRVGEGGVSIEGMGRWGSERWDYLPDHSLVGLVG